MTHADGTPEVTNAEQNTQSAKALKNPGNGNNT